MLAMPVKDALGRDLQLDYSNDIAQLRRQLDVSRERRQRWGERVALQRLTLEQVTHIHGYEQEVRRALQWLGELYAVLLRCHSHVGCNIHEIQLQKDELQGFEETGRVSFARERAARASLGLLTPSLCTSHLFSPRAEHLQLWLSAAGGIADAASLLQAGAIGAGAIPTAAAAHLAQSAIDCAGADDPSACLRCVPSQRRGLLQAAA